MQQICKTSNLHLCKTIYQHQAATPPSDRVSQSCTNATPCTCYEPKGTPYWQAYPCLIYFVSLPLHVGTPVSADNIPHVHYDEFHAGSFYGLLYGEVSGGELKIFKPLPGFSLHYILRYVDDGDYSDWCDGFPCAVKHKFQSYEVPKDSLTNDVRLFRDSFQ
jgi:hypothetical protein